MKIKGIDISYCQRKVDYGRLKKSGINFVIIRSGYREKTDDMLYTHLDGCKKAGIPVGIYVYAMARTTAEAVSEARSCLKSISGYEILYPIFYDLEDERLLDLTSKQRTDNALAFLGEIGRQGYYPAVYANPAWLDNYLEKDRLKNYDIWLAAWTENPDIMTKYNYNQTMWQWGLDLVEGISGMVDGNLCFTDYPSLIKSKGYNRSNRPIEKTKADETNYSEFKTVNKKYRCLGASVNQRRLASDTSAILKKLKKGAVYEVKNEIYKNGKLKWLEIDSGFAMFADQIGDILFEELVSAPCLTKHKAGDAVKITAPYAASAFAKTASDKAAFGEIRKIIKIIDDKSVNFPFMLGLKENDTSSANTTGFANANGILKVS